MNTFIARGCAGLVGVALLCAVVLASLVLARSAAAQEEYRWEPAEGVVGIGDGVRVAVRLTGPSGLVRLESGMVTAVRIDMGPDGMAMMEAPLRPVAAAEDESLAWETDLIMAGRWALSVTATPPGQAVPISGEVVFTAMEAPPDVAQSAFTWEAAVAEVPAGDAVRIAVRLMGPDGLVRLENGTVSAVRLDMGPDEMAMMEAPLRPVAAAEDESLAWETDLIMAGRWALSITVVPPGQAVPVTGEVIFTAVQPDAGSSDGAALEDGECEIVYYRNPMGLPDVSPTPKKDSMGMDYIPVCADEVSGPEGTVRVDAERLQRAGVRTEPARYRRLNRLVLGAAEVAAGEDRIAYVTAKFSGFVESRNLPVTGDFLYEGRPIARVWIEDPTLLQRQADYIVSLSRGDGSAERAAENLRLFDMPDNAIAAIRETGAAVRLIEIAAPISGIVTRRTAVYGMRFNAGEMLFELVDLSRVWVMVRVPEQEVDLLRPNQPATLRFFGLTDPVEARIERVYPTIEPGNRSGTARIVLDNPDGRYRIGMYAEAEIAVALTPGHVMTVPISAVIDDGERQVVFVVVDEGVLEPRYVDLGLRGKSYVEVRDGVSEGEEVVVAGNFLIDAESNLQAALAAIQRAGDER